MFQTIHSFFNKLFGEADIKKPVIEPDVQILSHLFDIINNMNNDNIKWTNIEFDYPDKIYTNNLIQYTIINKKLNGPFEYYYKDNEYTLNCKGNFIGNELTDYCYFKLDKSNTYGCYIKEVEGTFLNHKLQNGIIKIYSDPYYVAKSLKIYTMKNGENIEVISEHHILDNYYKKKCHCVLTGNYDCGKFLSSDSDPEIPDNKQHHVYHYENGTITINQLNDTIIEQYADKHKIITRERKL